MGTILFAGGAGPPSTGLSNTSYWPLTSSGCVVPSGRVMASGSHQVLATGIRGWLAGYGATRTVQMGIAGVFCAAFNVGASSGAQDTGVRNLSGLLTPGAASIAVYSSGRTYFGRAAGGAPSSVDNVGNTWPPLVGHVTYTEASTAPTDVLASGIAQEEATLGWTPPADNGGAAVTGYRVEVASDALFADIVATIDVAAATTPVTGLDPGTEYFVRVGAINAVTAAAASWSAWSATYSFTTLAGAFLKVAGTWRPVRVWLKVAGTWRLVRVWKKVGGSWVI